MTDKLQAVRGMNDVYGDEAHYRHHIEQAFRHLASQYGYERIDLPIVENTALFKRTIGDATDIVEKEMYTFQDRNGDSLTLRPEGTAGCVRAGIQHGLIYNQVRRLWYMGPMFRHERPQKGRYRQFYQFGAEAFGLPNPEVDGELIMLSARLWKALGLSDTIHLQINSLGTVEARARYRDALVAYYRSHESHLDEDSQRRLEANPLRILDSKNPEMAEVNAGAPQLLDYLDPQSKEHFEHLRSLLEGAAIDYTVNTHLVRGLDYYTETVFEWVSDDLGAQATVCAGGRYDGLVKQLGGHPTPACGLAIGIERLVLLLQHYHPELPAATALHGYGIAPGEGVLPRALLLAEKLRDALPGLSLEMDCSGRGFGKQMKKADKSTAQVAIIFGEDELLKQQLTIKPLRREESQVTLPWEEAVAFLKKSLSL